MRVVTGIAVTVGVSVGFGLGQYLATGKSGPESFFAQGPVTTAAPKLAPITAARDGLLSRREVENSRQQHFADITSIRDVLQIPNDFDQTEALYALAGRSGADQLQSLIEEANRLSIDGERLAALQILFLRYSEIDPQAALIHLDSLAPRGARAILSSIFRSWSKVDPDAAIATANRINDRQQRRTASEAIMRTVADHTPQLLPQAAAQLHEAVNSERFALEGIVRQAETDPQAAIEAAQQLADKQLRQRAVYGIALNMAKQNPQQALRFMRGLDDARLRRELMRGAMSEWAKIDPEAALAYARSEGLTDTGSLIATAMREIARDDPLAALNQADLLDMRARQSAYASIYSTWGQVDLQAAISHAESLDNDKLQMQVFSSLAREYANRFPEEALLWAEQFDGPMQASIGNMVLREIGNSRPQLALEAALSATATPARNQTVNHILRSLAATDPQTAVNYLERLPPGPARERSRQHIIQSWAAQDLDAAYAWVNQLEGKAYTQTVVSLSHQLAASDPDRAAQLTDQIRGDARQQWISNVAANYAQRNQSEAVDWLQQYQREPGYSKAMRAIAQVAAQTDPMAALAMVDDITSAQDRQVAVDTITRTWSSREPAAAAAWAETLEDPSQRSSAIRIAANRWARFDPQAAGQWVMQLKSDSARDDALVSLVHQHRDSADSALPLINAMQSEQRRLSAVSSLYTRMLQYDPDGAEDFLARTGISAQSRGQLRRQMQRDRNE